MPDFVELRRVLNEAAREGSADQKTALVRRALDIVNQIDRPKLTWQEMDALQIMKNLGARVGHVVKPEAIGKVWANRTPDGDRDTALAGLSEKGLLAHTEAGLALTESGYNY